MMFVTLIAAVGTLCWLVFTFTVYTVPAFVGLSAGMFAYQTGAGAFGAIAVGLIAAVATLVLGRHLIASSRSREIRLLVSGLFVGPAGFAGYRAVHGILEMSPPAPVWHELLSLAGALLIGIVAWSRIEVPAGVDRGGRFSGRWGAVDDGRAIDNG